MNMRILTNQNPLGNVIFWFNILSTEYKINLHDFVKVCSKIIGARQRDVFLLWENQVVNKGKEHYC